MANRTGGDIDERLDRIERTLERVAGMIDGNPDWGFIGFRAQIGQFSEYIKTAEEWKRTTQRRIEDTERRIGALEGDKKIVLSPSAAMFLIIIGALCLIVAFFAISYLQGAG